MTDEERARDIGCGWCGDGGRGDLLAREILAALSEARADQREKDARIAECSYDDRSRVQSGNIDWDDGHRQGTRDAAAAIRAVGDKGNG